MPSESSSNDELNIILTAGGSVVVGCFLLLTYYIFLLRYRFAHAHFTPSSHVSTTAEDEDEEEEEDQENDQMHLRQQVWSYVRTLGLDADTIHSIPSFAVEGGDAKTAGLDCSVCLGELTEGEFVRSLPTCGHIFHVSCIDTWLSSHANCPLCRHLAIVEADPILLETIVLPEEEESQETR